MKTIRAEFNVHILNDVGIAKAIMMAEKFTELLNWLEQDGMCAPGRELQILKTKLEEASFFAKKSMAIHPINQRRNDV